MGKYDMKKKKKNQKEPPLWLIPVCAVLLPILVITIGWLRGVGPAPTTTPPATEPTETTTNVLVPTFPTVTADPTLPTEETPFYPYLDKDLRIDYIGSYIGIFMEDGTDEEVVNVLMLIVENTGNRDLQLARIDLEYRDFTANFSVTNLPAGEKVVLLETNRHAYVDETPLSANAHEVVFFPEPMNLMEDKISLSGGDGYINVTNTTDTRLDGEFFVYYKNSAADLLYGGITYRVRISNGIDPGETIRVMTNHYHPDRCTFLMVAQVE